MLNSTKRRLSVLGLATALALTGCASDSTKDTPSATPTTTAPAATQASAADIALVDALAFSSKEGVAPTVEVDPGFAVTASVVRVAKEGTGAELAEGDLVTFQWRVINGADGAEQYATKAGEPESFRLNLQSFGDVLLGALKGQKVGTQLIVAQPQTDETTGESATMVMAFEVTDSAAVGDRAEGEAVTPAKGLPTVTLAENGAPSITIPEDLATPKELVVQTLIKGAGAKVTADQSISAHYTGWLFDGTVFDSSWEGGTAADFSLTGVIEGWTKGLAGQTVGSQVLLVIPSELAYKEAGQGTIPANAPLVFVVDILAAY